jgi:hypothetical protein
LLPTGELPAGTHVVQGGGISAGVDVFAVQYSLTTTGPWTLLFQTATGLGLDRRSGMYFVEVSSGFIHGDTPKEAIANACPSGDAGFGAPTDTTLFGAPALEEEGTIVTPCIFSSSPVGTLTLNTGDRYRVVSGEVDGRVVTVLADFPTTDTAFPRELDALTASLTLAG